MTSRQSDGSVFVFSRDTTDGTLTLIETFREDVDHIGIGTAIDATITPDGAGVYVAAYNGDTAGGLVFFSRDAGMQGKLSFKGKISQVETGIPLTNATAIAMSPDGNNVYAVAFTSNSVVQFNTQPIADSGSGQASCDGTIASPFPPCDRLANTWAFCPIFIIGGVSQAGVSQGWYDPPYALGYDYAIVPGTNMPNFKTVTLLNIGDGLFDLYLFDSNQNQFVFTQTIKGLETYDFGPQGVDRFRILGIELNLVDATDTLGFRTQLSFVDDVPAGSAPRFTMEPITPPVNGSECGNGFVEAGEQCDEGSQNGTSEFCCTSACLFRASGEICRPAADASDLAETCTGQSGWCPPDVEVTLVDADQDGFTVGDGDCNDNDPTIHPGAAEICDGIDNNCNGQVDEGGQNTFYRDADGDGFGNPTASTQACTAPAGYVVDHTDCNDGNAAIHPGATELCNGVR